MKLPCELVRDLLPLYHDGVCSTVSAELVKSHLEECPECQHSLNKFVSNIEVSDMEIKKSTGLAAIQKSWKKGLLRSFAKGLLIATLVCSILFGGFLALTQINFPIDVRDWEVAEIYQLENGNILYRMDAPGGLPYFRSFRFRYTADRSYKYPVKPVIDTTELQGFPPASLTYQEIDVGEHLARASQNGYPAPFAWYWGKPGRAVLIYELGMEVPPAPQELEALYG